MDPCDRGSLTLREFFYYCCCNNRDKKNPQFLFSKTGQLTNIPIGKQTKKMISKTRVITYIFTHLVLMNY